jgi:formiminoglutamase
MNEGRIGAKKGPDEIKKAFAQLPDLSECESLVDYGNSSFIQFNPFINGIA